MVLIGITFQYLHKSESPPPDVCSCERLSFRHAVSYHDTEVTPAVPSHPADRAGGRFSVWCGHGGASSFWNCAWEEIR
jgi:hypothetical protein